MSDFPLATYRLQINKDFTLYDAADILPYLKTLGVTHLYLSPVFESTKGSMHGYDICDFTKISEERGGEEAFAALDSLCRQYDMHLLLDIVPNHMGIAGENPFWIDVLAKGRSSRYWPLFDLRVERDEQIHLPVLDKPLDEALSSGAVKFEDHADYGRILSIGNRIIPLSGDDLERQAYKLVSWTETFEKISYRRFFDITDLIGVRVEDRNIYDLSHRCLLELCRKYPSIAGVRVDHIDGLADPTTYLSLLRDDVSTIWVEKILSGPEELPAQWPVQGTTGYEFIARLNDLMVDAAGFETLNGFWCGEIEDRWTGFDDCVLKSKNEILDSLFQSELKRLVRLSEDRASPEQAEIFWRGMTVCLDVYRTYAGEQPLSAHDKDRIARAPAKARTIFGPDFEAAESVFMPVLLTPRNDIEHQIVREWQQLSGPAMAKGLEDCAHYRYTPLAALNEVGCEADLKNNGADDYFDWYAKRLETHPYSLLATSTHDTKRSEDARARLYVLADRPQEWIDYYRTAIELSAESKGRFRLRPATEYFLYQALIALWPLDGRMEDSLIDRLCAYMQKSVKEARMETSWLDPDQAYEGALETFIRTILKNKRLIEHTEKFVHAIAGAGAVNSLTALTLKIFGPGIPDFYQGCEGWAFNLVDPDNRRPVDFSPLMSANATGLGDARNNWRSSEFKIWYTRKLLALRHTYNDKLMQNFSPVTVSGPQENHVIAYRAGDLIVVCLRHPGKLKLAGLTCDLQIKTDLSAGRYTNLMTDEELLIDDAKPWQPFCRTPTCILKKIDAQNGTF